MSWYKYGMFASLYIAIQSLKRIVEINGQQRKHFSYGGASCNQPVKQ